MISFAGVGFAEPDAALDADLLRWWHRERLWEADGAGFRAPGLTHLPAPPPPRPEPPRLGVLRWPTGASRWATFHGLMSGEQLARVRTAVGTAGSGTLLMADGAGGSVSPTMFVLAPTPVSLPGGVAAGAADLWLVTLVDVRYFWWGASADPEDAGAGWDGLIGHLFDAAGVGSPTVGTVPAGYGSPSERWHVGRKPVPPLIDAACRTVGLRAARTLSGDVKAVRWADADELAADQLVSFAEHVISGGEVVRADVARAVPAGVKVAFWTGAAAEDRTLTGLALSEFGGAAGLSGKTGFVLADLGSGDESARDAYADEAAKDYYRWQLVPADVAFRGCVAWEPTGLEDAVEWHHGRDGVTTRVLRPPASDANVYGDRRGGGGDESIWIRITGFPDADDPPDGVADSNEYDWEEVERVAGAWQAVDGGKNSDDDGIAREANENLLIREGTVWRAWPDADGEAWSFNGAGFEFQTYECVDGEYTAVTVRLQVGEEEEE